VLNPTGKYVTCTAAGESYQAFVPDKLPPALQLAQSDQDLVDQANRALGRLDGASAQLPNAALFTYFYVRKEAVLSSQIEGTQSSLSDLLMHEHDGAPIPLDDVQEVSSYVRALDHGVRRIREDNFPPSLRLLKEIHAILLEGGRGAQLAPGEFRRTQNWLGGTRPGSARFVPPPPESIMDCLGDLEKFLHDIPERTPTLLKAALAHVQFETIHPFLDGNGRLGRLLIALLLCAENVLTEPLLYLSLYFKLNREAYYDGLERVRTEGDWLGWIRFFMTGVRDTATEAVDTARKIGTLFGEDVARIEKTGRRSQTMLRLHDLLQRQAIVSVPSAVAELGLSAPTVRTAL